MKLLTKTISVLCAAIIAVSCVDNQKTSVVDDTPGYTLADEQVSVKIAEDGTLLSLANVKTGTLR